MGCTDTLISDPIWYSAFRKGLANSERICSCVVILAVFFYSFSKSAVSRSVFVQNTPLNATARAKSATSINPATPSALSPKKTRTQLISRAIQPAAGVHTDDG